MAIGTSSLGLQLCETSVPPQTGRFTVDYRNVPIPPRLSRLGTVLVCQAIGSPVNRRVIRVYKLYGGGMAAAADPLVVQTGIVTEIWVNWFLGGILWTVAFF